MNGIAEASRSSTRVTRLSLALLRPGQQGVILDTRLDSAEAATLRAMGLRPETRVVLCRAGEPCIVRVVDGCCAPSGGRIGLSRALAEHVMVAVIETPETA